MALLAGVLSLAPPAARAAVTATQPSRGAVEAANNVRRIAEPAYVLLGLVVVVGAIATFLIVRFRRVAQGAGPRRMPPVSSSRPSPGGSVDRQSRVVPFPPSADDVPEWQPSEARGTGVAPTLEGPPVLTQSTPPSLPISGQAPGGLAASDLAAPPKSIRLKPSGHGPVPFPVPVAAPAPPPRAQQAAVRATSVAEPEAPAGFPKPPATESLVPSSNGLPPLPKLKLTMSPVPKTVVHVTPAMEYASKRVRQSA